MVLTNIKLTSAGACSGPCDLYSDADNYAVPFDTGISITVLTGTLGYSTFNVPAGSPIVRIQNNKAVCSNFVDTPITT